MGFVVHAVSDLRPLSVAVVAEGESVRGGEMIRGSRQQRGWGFDGFVLELIVEIVSWSILLVLG